LAWIERVNGEARSAGGSKLDAVAIWEFCMLLVDKVGRGYIPIRFFEFCLVGSAGVLIHMVALYVLLVFGSRFSAGQALATLTAMTFNFAVNNVLTYRDRRLSGLQWFRGLLSFIAVCGLGAFANVGLADYLFEHRRPWFVAGLAGVLVSACWNYFATRFFTWGERGIAR
jgi:dolichol-phosphate mannosyltransferase